MILSSRERAVCDRWLGECLAGIYQPQPDLTIWEWAEQNLRIPASENQDMAGQYWSSRTTPYVRDVMEWIRELGQKEMFIAKSSQIGLTMAVLICICWFIVHQPTNVGYYIDSVGEARKISKTRLQRWILDNGLLDEIGEPEEEMNNLTYSFRGMTVYLHGSHTGGGYRNKSLGIAILDELEAHPHIDEEGTTADLARGRVKVPPNSKLLGFSTPKTDKGVLWVEYLAGTQEKFFVQCPHCQHMQDLIWGRVRFDHCKDTAGEYDLHRILTDTYYECELGCHIQQTEKTRLFEKTEWRATSVSKNPRVRSKQISDLYSPFVTWGVLAVEFLSLSKNKEKLRAFSNQRLAEAFAKQGGELRENDLLRLRQKYPKGTLPVKPWFIVLAVDVQKTTLKWVVLAFNRTGDCWVIDWGEYSTWEELTELIDHPFSTIDGEEHHILYTCVDEGDGNRNKEVRRYCLSMGDYVIPVKGRSQSQMRDFIQPRETWVDGYEVTTYFINDHVYKSELLFSRIKSDREKKNEENHARLYLPRPQDVDPNFIAELMAEKLMLKTDKNGYEKLEWVKSGTNDWLDAIKYGIAMYDIGSAAILEEEQQENNNDTATAH